MITLLSLFRLSLAAIVCAMFGGWIMMKQEERRRALRGYWVENISPGVLRADDGDFAVVYHEAGRCQFFYGKIGDRQNPDRLFVPGETRWQTQMPNWLHGRRETVLERIEQEARRVQIVTELMEA